MSRPKIGIVGWSTGDNSFGTTKAYLHHLSMFGNVRILCPMEDIDEDLDLVVLPGGKDTLSSRYGCVPGYFNTDPDLFKEAFVDINLPKYIERGIPIWGTCLGFQQLIVHFGGKLAQHIPLSKHGYSDVEKKGRGDLVNDLIFPPAYKKYEAALLSKTPKEKVIQCCSLHHQGVKLYKNKVNAGLPDCIDVIAYTDDSILECFKHKELPIAGGQMHTEEDFNTLGNQLILELITKSPNYKQEYGIVNFVKSERGEHAQSKRE